MREQKLGDQASVFKPENIERENGESNEKQVFPKDDRLIPTTCLAPAQLYKWDRESIVWYARART